MYYQSSAFLPHIFVLLTTTFLSLYSSAGEIYKCRDLKGKISFSDQPCPEHAQESVLNQSGSGSAWLDRLRAESLPAIRIDNISRTEHSVEIEYRFKSNSASSAFIRRAQELSNMNVNIAKQTAPIHGRSGYVKMEISKEPAMLAEQKTTE